MTSRLITIDHKIKSMKTIILLCLATLFIINIPFAQTDGAFKTFKMESIYLKGGKYVKNDVEYSVGFFKENLRDEMKISPHAIAEWNKHVKFRNWSMLTSLSGLALTIAALNADDNVNRRSLVLAGLGLSIISIPLSIKSQNQLHKSVWTHNRDLFQM